MQQKHAANHVSAGLAWRHPVSAASQVHYGALHVPKAILLSTGRIASGLLTTIAPMFLQEHNSA